MTKDDIKQLVLSTLADMKAKDVSELDVSALTDMADSMIIASGTSSRHVRSIAASVVSKLKEHNVAIVGVEGDDVGDWVLVDLADIILHIMLPESRDFYALEKLWASAAARREASIP